MVKLSTVLHPYVQVFIAASQTTWICFRLATKHTIVHYMYIHTRTVGRVKSGDVQKAYQSVVLSV